MRRGGKKRKTSSLHQVISLTLALRAESAGKQIKAASQRVKVSRAVFFLHLDVLELDSSGLTRTRQSGLDFSLRI